MHQKHREEIKRLEDLEDKAIKEGGDVDSIIARKWELFQKLYEADDDNEDSECKTQNSCA